MNGLASPDSASLKPADLLERDPELAPALAGANSTWT
jgi:hypothetical protein